MRFVRMKQVPRPFSVGAAMLVAACATGCGDATQLTSVDATRLPGVDANPEPVTHGMVIRVGPAALASAERRALLLAESGDNSFYRELQVTARLRPPVAPRLNTQPTGTEPPAFVQPTYTRPTISPYNAGVLVEMSFYYAYHLTLNGQWGMQSRSSSPSSPYGWAGNVAMNWDTGLHHHALDVDILSVPQKCGTTMDASTTHTISRQEYIPGWGTITWSPASAVSSTHGGAQQNACAERDETKPAEEVSSSGGGNSGCPECIQEPASGYSWCMVRYWYWMDTGEIYAWEVLYCW